MSYSFLKTNCVSSNRLSVRGRRAAGDNIKQDLGCLWIIPKSRLSPCTWGTLGMWWIGWQGIHQTFSSCSTNQISKIYHLFHSPMIQAIDGCKVFTNLLSVLLVSSMIALSTSIYIIMISDVVCVVLISNASHLATVWLENMFASNSLRIMLKHNDILSCISIRLKGCWPYFGPDIFHYVFYSKWKGIIRAV